MPPEPESASPAGSASSVADGAVLRAGALAWTLQGGSLRGVTFAGTEVLRHIDFPIRDADWRTLATEAVETRIEDGKVVRLAHRFRTVDGGFDGALEVEAAASGDAGRLVVRLRLTATRATVVNRAGFVLLHPIAGVAGTPVEVRHPDGGASAAQFPERISPAQPIFDIAGLRHRVGPVEVDITMTGEVFEMEDQRNWTDASFKTYCRPLARPRPFTLEAGETVDQRIEVALALVADGSAAAGAGAAAARARAPRIALAHEGASGLGDAAALGVDEALVRIDAAAPAVAGLAGLAPELTLEIVVGDEPPAEALARVAAACAAAELRPARVIALPAAYLASHQPDGVWPSGPTPMDLVPLAREAFPDAAVGGGMLTNFTEFNRHRPDPAAIDFATFGGTAIVHAADDRSVLETLEALGDVFASARAIARDRPLRLGLLSIGMRSNPYGSAVAANPDGARLPMAMDDPRQRELFGAAWAVGVAAAAARGGVESYAPVMSAGPIGPGAAGALWPVHAVVAALAALGGADVEVSGGPSTGVVRIEGEGRRGVRGVAANLGPDPARVAAPEGALLLALDAAGAAGAARDAAWIDRPGGATEMTLGRFEVAIFKATAS